MEDETISEKSPPKPDQTEFKKPVLIGRIGKLPKKAKTEPEKVVVETKSEEKSIEQDSESEKKSSLPPAVLLKELTTPIPYKEPKWSGLCPEGTGYALEVLKSGMIVDRIELGSKPYYVFGRLANCDVVMAHPTISRHHCVIQYKAFAEEGEPPCGWYLQDLGSTHGTFLNKERLKAGHYTRARVGHQLKFGTSTRTYIMMGPDFDCEGESELTVTEIKKRALIMKLERDRAIQEDREQRERDRLEEERKKEEQGIDWGMGEDAEEEPDLTENPYASTANEELYLEDPKKTLRGYFEREGHELTYDCEERGVGQFICRVELPIDDARGNPVVAEVIHRGKKKEAVVACALEACRVLDRAGLLRQARHESRKKKQRDWSADDYYDSDDDAFLDRTGGVERRRKKRMQRMGAAEEKTDQPLTYEDLLKQISELEAKISSEEKTLERQRASSKPTLVDEEEDELDAFMSSLKSQGQSMAQKADISNTKMRIKKLQAELTKTQRLAELARPAHVPPLVKRDDSKMGIKMAGNSVVYGKRIRLKEDTEKKPKKRQAVQKEAEEFVEEMDSDEEVEQKTEVVTSKTDNVLEESSKRVEKEDRIEESGDSKQEIKEDSRTKEKKEKKDSEKAEGNGGKKIKEVQESKDDTQKKVYGPMRPPENYVVPENYFDQESDRDLPEIMEDE